MFSEALFCFGQSTELWSHMPDRGNEILNIWLVMLTRIPVARRVLTQQVLTVFIFFFLLISFVLDLGYHTTTMWPWPSDWKTVDSRNCRFKNRLKAFNNNNNSIYLNTIKKFIKLYNNKIKLFLWKLNFPTNH